ncbi:MAG: hypothetical protein IPK68_09875 [Bdellovibrionales bacterium]|nr:hypothetical protein [Bdellovibrionales bacterium]
MHRNEYDPYTYYNWQFLRRSPEYRRAYDEYAKFIQDDEPKAESMLFDLHSRWGMSTFADWNLELPPLLPDLFFDPVTCLGLFNYNELTSSKNPIEDLTELRPGNLENKRFMLVALDLERLRSKDYKSFHAVVSRVQAANELKDPITAKRFTANSQHLDVVLATYDEYEKNPKANSYELATKLLPLYATAENPKPNQHTQKVEATFRELRS